MNTIFNARRNLSRLIVAFIFGFFATSSAALEQPRIQFSNGDAFIIGLDGKQNPAIKGDVLLPGEKLMTGPGGMVQLRVFDQGVVALQESSELDLKIPEGGNFGIALNRGVMRTVTKLGYRKGKIDITTPGAKIAVSAGDVLTGVGALKEDAKTTHNQVLDGKVRITTGRGETIAEIGKILQINPEGTSIDVISIAPAGMRLSIPSRTTVGKSDSLEKSLPKVAVLKTAAAASLSSGSLGVVNPINSPKIATIEPVIKASYDGIKIIDPRITIGSVDDQAAVNSALFVSLQSPLTGTNSLDVIKTTDTALLNNLASGALVVNLEPTTSIADETTLSSALLPEIKVVTYEPTKIILGDGTYNSTLANSVKTDTTKTTTICATCTKTLSLIRN